jgi:hypothetical protein
MSTYKYIRIEAISTNLGELVNPESEYNEGVARERALAESAPYLAERVKYLEWLVAQLREDNDK